MRKVGVKGDEKKKIIEIVKAMFAKRASIEFIADCISMSIQDIKDIFNDLNFLSLFCY